jgi:hypothetical protein
MRERGAVNLGRRRGGRAHLRDSYAPCIDHVRRSVDVRRGEGVEVWPGGPRPVSLPDTPSSSMCPFSIDLRQRDAIDLGRLIILK